MNHDGTTSDQKSTSSSTFSDVKISHIEQVGCYATIDVEDIQVIELQLMKMLITSL
jgi:hypothetical protein